ncbi:MAG TPA: hypothetical protein PLV25_06510 [Opitutales bacterium]|nr:hypothetical protein [Opitutales bacterium]
MIVDKVITLASSPIKTSFFAMERSLRATGCELPLYVIPYNDQKFDLPQNASWFENAELFAWLKERNAHATMRKYICALVANYQFVDSDVVFLKNPYEFLMPFNGFVTSCGHWNNPNEAVSQESRKIFAHHTTVWPKLVFNSGQFACDKPLFRSFNELKDTAQSPENVYTCLQFPYNEQPGLNLLRERSGVNIIQLTLPPYNMESTWAGDYTDIDFTRYWDPYERMPYLLHWAGRKADGSLPIDEYFFKWLTPQEKAAYMREAQSKSASRIYRGINKVRYIWKSIKNA